jgi:hypothetical protein
MKKVIITARKENFEKIEPILKDVFHFLNEEDDLVRITIYLHDEGLDDLISKLHDTVDKRCKESMIEVFTPDFIISPALKRAEKKIEKPKEKTPVEKLIYSTKPHLRLDIGKIALTSVAGIIALTGLFMNSSSSGDRNFIFSLSIKCYKPPNTNP